MTFIERSDEYWEKRAQEQLTFLELEALPFLKTIDRVYLDARRANLEAVKSLYVNYYKKEGWDTTALRQIAPKGDIRRFQEAVKAAGLESRLPDGYGFRLSRLELLEAQMWLESNKAGAAQVALQTSAHTQTIKTAYEYSLYNLSKGTGVVPVFSQMNTRTINRILKTDFYGKNYSKRIWNNTAALAKDLKQTLATSIATGQSYTKTAKDIKERYNVTRYQATRLVQTETARFNTEATDESYNNIGIEEWVYIATLDSRTDDDCGRHDGKRYPMDGGPYIPLHPGCRCCKRAYFTTEYEPDERIMRDPVTGKNRYVSNLSFDQWKGLYK
jgi:SPP1 gp7 family putative phage head morphogenesis protein